ncbi:MAG: YeeE/YedE family protein [Rhodospirillales bacterium]|nr:YeeE/YedE family protein [Rhodospirillales bacterium]MCW8951521.1 YeeE/YedE family protein [Rhodospirillales bacterium]MCW9003047.1 YeeE/YedE family protein [Rhodospirillales bacterium]MCW9039630.1 YeeE/YedE family protein [Rhodospirillales bacterium]
MDSVVGECLVAFVFGSIVGLLVQRSRFCNTAALRDAILFKTYRNTKALLVAMMILTIGFTAFLTIGEGKAMHFDVGLNQVMGLFLFGIGMVLAGACTVSTWVKTAEGNVGALWALLFTFIGMFLFSLMWSVNFWPPASMSMTSDPNLEALQLGYSNARTLQDKFGVPAIVFGVIQALALFAIYRAIGRKEKAQKRHHDELAASHLAAE